MREIKFRVWDKKERKFRLPFEFAIDGDGVLVSFEGDYWRNVTDKDRYEISFYTGLKDKNGKEIYEGDIVKLDEFQIYLVEWDEERAGWFPFAHGDGCGCCEINTVHNSKLTEVIGNVYENPELSEIS